MSVQCQVVYIILYHVKSVESLQYLQKDVMEALYIMVCTVLIIFSKVASTGQLSDH